jgi:hypothetical protein
VDVQRLALVDEGAAVGSHLEDGLLRNLPNGFVQRFQI